MSVDKPLSCPFGCKEEVHVLKLNTPITYQVCCIGCDFSGPEKNSLEEAITIWNDLVSCYLDPLGLGNII